MYQLILKALEVYYLETKCEEVASSTKTESMKILLAIKFFPRHYHNRQRHDDPLTSLYFASFAPWLMV